MLYIINIWSPNVKTVWSKTLLLIWNEENNQLAENSWIFKYTHIVPLSVTESTTARFQLLLTVSVAECEHKPTLWINLGSNVVCRVFISNIKEKSVWDVRTETKSNNKTEKIKKCILFKSLTRLSLTTVQ